jgi:Ca2+-binding RTX toxin-like protein
LTRGADWNLATGALSIGSAPRATSTIRGFESILLPSKVAWSVVGSSRGEELVVSSRSTADVTFAGRGGRDTFSGAKGDDVFDGGAGSDLTLDMGPGRDTCLRVERFGADPRCEVVS